MGSRRMVYGGPVLSDYRGRCRQWLARAFNLDESPKRVRGHIEIQKTTRKQNPQVRSSFLSGKGRKDSRPEGKQRSPKEKMGNKLASGLSNTNEQVRNESLLS